MEARYVSAAADKTAVAPWISSSARIRSSISIFLARLLALSSTGNVTSVNRKDNPYNRTPNIAI